MECNTGERLHEVASLALPGYGVVLDVTILGGGVTAGPGPVRNRGYAVDNEERTPGAVCGRTVAASAQTFSP
jgi:hypothetical protein